MALAAAAALGTRFTRAASIRARPGGRSCWPPLATLSNLAFKAGITSAMGGAALLSRTPVFFGATVAAGGALLLAWP